MTLTVGTQCPRCLDSIRLPLMAGEDEEGRFLSIQDEVFLDHAETCEVTQ